MWRTDVPTVRTLAAGGALAAAATLSPAMTASAAPAPTAPTTVAQKGACSTFNICPSTYHTRRGLAQAIKINCKHGEASYKYLYRGQSSKDDGKCGKNMDAVHVKAGTDLVYCNKHDGGSSHTICYTWRGGSTGWQYLKPWNDPKLHVVHNGACGERCGPDDQ